MKAKGNERRLAPFGKVALAVAACVLAAAFCSLGIWQLRRLTERRAQNAMLLSRRSYPPADLDSLPRDTAAARFRRVRIAGSYDFSREFALTLRTRNGSPGVNIITPLRRPGNDTLVLVNRGWIYAPDGMTADISKWREPGTVNTVGFVETFPPPSGFTPRSPRRVRSYRWLNRSTIATDMAAPIAPVYVIIAPDSEEGYAREPARDAAAIAQIPPRLEPRPLDEGPHRSYAIQWFSFAAISIIGMIIFLRRA